MMWREREWRYIIEEIEQREGERRQELAEKAVTRVLLMCNETLHPGRDNRKDGRMEGDGERERERKRKNVAVMERREGFTRHNSKVPQLLVERGLPPGIGFLSN
ncbi:hypothetical protein GBF38_011336 [Nibea albiflora]|uniref:Uncharacterized protein n=1 Tax=Nibea albiflora TaxID=240163 RepID=A0ACB7ET01_NIBAL|nr:hypothetical protein GBF38_011336 [Nibea albiflora]